MKKLNIKTSDSITFLEINGDNYEKLPFILEKIAGKILILYKIAGVIPYLEED